VACPRAPSYPSNLLLELRSALVPDRADGHEPALDPSFDLFALLLPESAAADNLPRANAGTGRQRRPVRDARGTYGAQGIKPIPCRLRREPACVEAVDLRLAQKKIHFLYGHTYDNYYGGLRKYIFSNFDKNENTLIVTLYAAYIDIENKIRQLGSNARSQ
jgi:hypothetical protein